jgi:hypothetical protein
VTASTAEDRPALRALRLADDPATWTRLGFAVGTDGVCRLGGVAIELVGTGGGRGLVGWRIDGVPADAALDGLPPAASADAPAVGDEPAHPNGAVAVDHVVAATPDVDRTVRALAAAGLEARRVREAGTVRQAFYVVRTALLEVAGPAEPSGDGPAELWGLVVVVPDLDALARRLGDVLGTVRDAVQPGRRIATLRDSAGSSTAVAFLTARGH